MTEYYSGKLPDSISAGKRMSLNECVGVVETNWVLVFEPSPLGKEEDTAKSVLVRLKKMAESVTSSRDSVRPTTLKRIVSNVKYVMTLINAPELKAVELLENGQASGSGQALKHKNSVSTTPKGPIASPPSVSPGARPSPQTAQRKIVAARRSSRKRPTTIKQGAAPAIDSMVTDRDLDPKIDQAKRDSGITEPGRFTREVDLMEHSGQVHTKHAPVSDVPMDQFQLESMRMGLSDKTDMEGVQRSLRFNADRLPTIADEVNETSLLFVVDGPNIAHRHGFGNFSPKGMLCAYTYFTRHGFNCVVVVPDGQLRLQMMNESDSSMEADSNEVVLALRTLVLKGNLVLTPREDYDDSYIVNYGMSKGAIVVSNDRYRDHLSQAEARGKKFLDLLTKYLKACRLSFAFRGDEFIPSPDFDLAAGKVVCKHVAEKYREAVGGTGFTYF
ncbi:hypothetical protein NDN08_006825 [Rhodosorus marinus]|uniref:RNase NYN domain-containing protein n=1 Tax=Rhodosorus marinus TaxID=101924 RepID=A0AAV8UIQ0_9RHOD|nr:hypothetical protein NDN08_006825 [Rhodosorus marinus]